jgi:hypothetical protein
MGNAPYVHSLWPGLLGIIKLAMASAPHEREVVMAPHSRLTPPVVCALHRIRFRWGVLPIRGMGRWGVLPITVTWQLGALPISRKG